MKKLLFLLTFGLMTIIGNAQDSTKLAIPDTSLVTYTKVYNDVKEGLTAIGESLKVGSIHVYEVLIRQQRIQSFTLLAVFFIGILLTMLCLHLYKIADWEFPNPPNLLCIISGIFGIIAVGGSILTIRIIITGFFNPEYGAIMDILNAIK